MTQWTVAKSAENIELDPDAGSIALWELRSNTLVNTNVRTTYTSEALGDITIEIHESYGHSNPTTHAHAATPRPEAGRGRPLAERLAGWAQAGDDQY